MQTTVTPSNCSNFRIASWVLVTGQLLPLLHFNRLMTLINRHYYPHSVKEEIETGSIASSHVVGNLKAHRLSCIVYNVPSNQNELCERDI